MSSSVVPLLENLESSLAPSLGSSYLADVRQDALANLRSRGLPTKKTEAWRFTPVRALTSTSFASAPAGSTDSAAFKASVTDDLEGDVERFDVLNGRLSRNAAGSRVRSLAHVLEQDPAGLSGVLGAIAPQEHFVALNSVKFGDGVAIRVTADDAKRPIHLAHVFAPVHTATAVHSRLTVVLEKGAELTLIETFRGAAGSEESTPLLANLVSEIVVGPGARLNHVRFTEATESEGALHQLATVAVRVEERGEYQAQTVTLGGQLARVDLRVSLAGAGAECSLDGVYHVDGVDHVDHQTWVEHAAPQGSSRQTYRGVADGRGQAVFNGIVVVRPGAQQTSAHQENRNLLLSEDAVVHTKPHLEIDADDVSCSHGATVGALDEQALFYLRSRGIPESQARDMLVLSFAEAVVERIEHPATREHLRQRLASRFPGGLDALSGDSGVEREDHAAV